MISLKQVWIHRPHGFHSRQCMVGSLPLSHAAKDPASSLPSLEAESYTVLQGKNDTHIVGSDVRRV